MRIPAVLFATTVALAVAKANAGTANEGICILYADDTKRSFFFSGVSPTGQLVPQLLNLPTWDALLVGMDAGEDDDTFYIVPQGISSSPNMTIATLRTATNGTATVSYAVLGAVPAFPAPYTYMNTLHLDTSRMQMIATLVGLSGPPPVASSSSSTSTSSLPRHRRYPRKSLTDPGDLFYVVADVFPANGTVSKVWLDLSEYDMRWGQCVISGVSAFDGNNYWVNPIGGQVPSGQALYGFPLNGSQPIIVPYGPKLSLGHLFYSMAQQALLGILENQTTGVPSLVRFTPPSNNFTEIFTWPETDQDYGTYDVSKDGSQLLAVLVDKEGYNPIVSVVNLVGQVKEVNRIALKNFAQSDAICDINFCNV